MNIDKNMIRIVVFTLIFLTLPLKSYSVMVGLSTTDLTTSSDIVVVGQVENVESFWSQDKKAIGTSVLIIIENVIKGNLSQDRLIVEYKGGEMGDTALKVSDVSPLRSGEKVVLFLKSGKSKKNPGNVVFNIVGKGQGKYSVDGSGIATKEGFAIVGGEKDIDKRLPVDELIKKIKAANETK